ncbi:hypothetical protein [Microscilla marina]|uniref:STAS/SEC14 domain-containing protein n=1 Tax=Microscilla marina ATCC 23134 TaxID=313606 RepID=A1ZJQ4_MICM2|nr:hypothetical protein [Microscilla marina]EAY29357.1 hypothetical protein M23134_01413 [Microscilla marina ATCC 23134]
MTVLKRTSGINFVKIEHCKNTNTVITKWQGYCPHDNIMEGMQAGLTVLKSSKAKRWIMDTEMMEGSLSDSLSWLIKIWLPAARYAGLETMAFVTSRNIFTELSTKEYAIKSNKTGNEHFLSLEDAKRWIVKQ